MKTKRLLHFSFGILCLASGHLWSQDSFVEYNFVNIKEGVSKAAASTIIQDHYGFIWIGTNGSGLHRYDGIHYTSYKHELNDSTSLSSSLIYCSYLDKKNRLWIGAENGLNLYNRKLDRFKRIALVDRSKDLAIDNISVASLTEDDLGNLFVGTYERGLFKLDPISFTVEHIPSYRNGKEETLLNINHLKTTKDGKVYAGTSYGLEEYDPNTNMLRPSSFITDQGSKSIKDPVKSLLTDDKNNLWIGSMSNGVYKVDSPAESERNLFKISHYPVSNKRILSMISLSDNSVMCGTENDGLIHLNSQGQPIKNYLFNKTDENSIRSNSVWSLFLDANERIWIGYYNSGVGVYDKLYDKFKDIESLVSNPNSLESGSVTGIAQDRYGRLWIGMDGGGIDIHDPETNKFIHLNKSGNSILGGLTSSDIQTVFIDSKQNVWAGTWNNGLYVLKNGSKRFIGYNTVNTEDVFKSNSILSFSEDSDGIIWVGTFNNGILSYDPESESFTHHDSEPFVKEGIHDSAVRKVLVDSNNDIWVGTVSGLYKVVKHDMDSYSVVLMGDKMLSKHQNPTSSNHILSLYESSDGSLWIGTRGSGLCKYNKADDSFVWYNESYGLEEENVAAIIESTDGNIWISGNTGIYKLDTRTNAITNYSVNDGLLSNDFNFNAALRDKQGMIYFGNYKGVDYFNPERINVNKSVPSLYLTGFKLFNKDVQPNRENSPLKNVIAETDSIALNHKQSVFTIEYAGVNYTRPEKNQYAYYLEGLEETWNYVGDLRSATYTNLDQGEYTFKLKSANNDGVWNEGFLKLKITILPPWWETGWAIFTYLALFFLGIYLLNRITQSRIKEKQLIRNERDKRIQEDVLHEKKLQFFTNISHEFRTPLTLIINPLIDIIKDESLNLPKRTREKHNIILRNTDRLYRLINELMDFRKLELNKVRIKARQLNLVAFTKDVARYFEEEAFNKNIHLTIDADVPEIPVWADENMLDKIIFNILSNAIKVTPEGGAISIDILSTDKLVDLPLVDGTEPVKVVEVIISDTGPGLTKEQAERIFERFYQVENLNKTYYGGTGIGLEVVQNFMQLHKGKVLVESKLGKGSTFRILFPEGKEHFNENELFTEEVGSLQSKERFFGKPAMQNDEEEIVEGTRTKSHTLLIVEDNSELRNYLRDELKDRYKVLIAKNGREGLKIAKDALPDIILTDVIMPEMDGFVFCKKIKEDLRTSHIPLLMLTAKTKIDDRIEGIGFGADAYMAKPFDLRLLKLRLNQIVTSRQLIFDKYFGAISGTNDNANASSLDKDFIQKVLSYVGENMSDSDLSVELLASQLNLSRSQLYRKIKTLTGQTVNEFLRIVRLQKARQIIETENDVNISDVCYNVGFSSPSYFTKCFKAHFGVLPTDIEKH